MQVDRDDISVLAASVLEKGRINVIAAASEAPGELQKESQPHLKLTHSETHQKASTIRWSAIYRGEGAGESAREEQGGPNAAAPPAKAWAPNKAGNQGVGVTGSGSTEVVQRSNRRNGRSLSK